MKEPKGVRVAWPKDRPEFNRVAIYRNGVLLGVKRRRKPRKKR